MWRATVSEHPSPLETPPPYFNIFHYGVTIGHASSVWNPVFICRAACSLRLLISWYRAFSFIKNVEKHYFSLFESSKMRNLLLWGALCSFRKWWNWCPRGISAVHISLWHKGQAYYMSKYHQSQHGERADIQIQYWDKNSLIYNVGCFRSVYYRIN